MSIRLEYKKSAYLLVILAGLLVSETTLAVQPGTNLPKRTSGLNTNYAKIVVANLPIGQTVSMSQIANAPMLIGSNYSVPIYSSVRTEAPKEPKEGYDPIPDPSWVVVEPNGLTLQAYATAKLDVKVVLPEDETLFGRKYYCNIVLNTGGDPNIQGVRFGTEITGLFMFSIAPVRNETGLDAALRNPADAAYEIVPPVIIMKGIKPGQKIKIRTVKNKKVELINKSKKKQKYWLYSVNPDEIHYTLSPHSRFGGNVEDVILKADYLQVNPDSKKYLDFLVQVPKNADFSQGYLAYVVSISSGSSDKEGVKRFLAIYLEGEKTATEPKLENAAPQGVTTSAEIKNK